MIAKISIFNGYIKLHMGNVPVYLRTIQEIQDLENAFYMENHQTKVILIEESCRLGLANVHEKLYVGLTLSGSGEPINGYFDPEYKDENLKTIIKALMQFSS